MDIEEIMAKKKTPKTYAEKAPLKAGADKEKADNAGKTPLQIAEEKGHAEVAEMLKGHHRHQCAQ